MSKTVSQVFGLTAANELAAFAIDLACAAPEKIATATTRVPASMMAELREALDRAGIDWRHIVRERIKDERETARRRKGARLVFVRLDRDTELRHYSGACRYGDHSYRAREECECECHAQG